MSTKLIELGVSVSELGHLRVHLTEIKAICCNSIGACSFSGNIEMLKIVLQTDSSAIEIKAEATKGALDRGISDGGLSGYTPIMLTIASYLDVYKSCNDCIK
jgi:hypothetical protein